MTTALAKQQHATPDDIARMTRSWPDLLHTPIQTMTQAQTISEQCTAAMTPAPKKWLSGRVAALLSHFYVSSVSPEMMEAIAGDWHDALAKYPAWAVKNAVAWWLSEDNPKNDRKPTPGQIAARCSVETGVVKVAEMAVRRFHRENAPQPSAFTPRRDEPAPETKARVDAEVQAFLSKHGGQSRRKGAAQ